MTIKIEKNKIRVHLAKKGKGCSKIRKEPEETGSKVVEPNLVV